MSDGRASRGRVCPGCGGPGIPWVYGMPGSELFEAAARGEVTLGGCCPHPGRTCDECGAPLAEDEWANPEPMQLESQGAAQSMRTPNDDEIRRAEQIARRAAVRHLQGRAWEGIDPEDVIQEVLLRFAQLDLDEIANPDAWITTATRNRCRDVREAARRHNQRQIGAGPNPDVLRVDEIRDVVMSVVGPSQAAIAPQVLAYALAELSDREREILLWHADGWTNAEVAAHFGYATPQSAAVAITRAKQKVRQRFESASQRRELVNPQRAY
jgi:RNA polymerase sigma factor (sigma-70 family)